VRPARSLAGLAALTGALGAAAALTAAPALAAPPAPAGGMTLEARSEAGRPVTVRTNHGVKGCQSAPTPLGTVTVTGLKQGGKDVQPVLSTVDFRQSPQVSVRRSLRPLAPGQSVTVPLSIVPAAGGGHVLQTIAVSETGGSALRYPVSKGEIALELAYSVPVTPTGGAACADAAGSGTVAVDPAAPPLAIDARRGATKTTYPLALVAGSAAALLVAGGGTLVLARRRNRAAALAVLLLAGLAAGVAGARQAHAEIDLDPTLEAAYNTCLPMMKSDPAHILDVINAPGATVHIIPEPGTGSKEIGDGHGNKDVFVVWDLDEHVVNVSAEDSCVGLYHEFSHAFESLEGILTRAECVTAAGPSGLPTTEVNATRAENALLAQLGLPQRSTYGNTPLPAGDCQTADAGNAAPVPPTCPPGAKCGDSNGDPHLSTLDGRRYDFQALGDFVLSADPAGGFAVQTRNTAVNSGRLAAITTAVAFDVSGDRVEMSLVDGAVSVRTGGKALSRAGGRLPRGGSVTVQPATPGPVFTLAWPDGSRVIGKWIGRYGARLIVAPAKARLGHLTGLLGNGNGDPADDLQVRGGARLDVPPGAQPAYDQLYPRYSDSWRVPPDGSLFSTPSGPVDRSFPDRPPPRLPGRATAEALCRKLGVIEPVALADCAFDVAITGRTEFAVAAAQAEDKGGALTVDGPPRTVHIGAKQRLNLAVDGTAGDTVFVRVTAATLPSQCGVLVLFGPDGTQLASGCVISGRGSIRAVRLPVTGRYQLQLRPDGAGGTATVSVNTAAPRQAALPADRPTTVRVTAPGGTVALPFAGRAGQVAVVNAVGGTVPDQCGVLALTDSGGGQLASGCIIKGRGGTNPVRLPADGTYTLRLDPEDDGTGSATLLLSIGTGTDLGSGDSLTLSIGQPGAVGYASFTARAGQRASIAVSGSTMGTTCSTPRILGPAPGALGSGCVSGAAGDITATLPAAGRYVVYYNPDADETGTARVTLRLTG
jgi:von Willebrand factor type D domain